MSVKGRETITIIRRDYSDQYTDEYGNSTPSTIELIVKNCGIGWGATVDQNSEIVETNSTKATIYFPYKTKVLQDDRFVLPDGRTAVFEGAPTVWVPQVGSPVKPKVIVNVGMIEG